MTDVRCWRLWHCTLVQMPDIHLMRLSLHGEGGFDDRGLLSFMQVMGIDAATHQETSGGQVMNTGQVAHGILLGWALAADGFLESL